MGVKLRKHTHMLEARYHRFNSKLSRINVKMNLASYPYVSTELKVRHTA